MINIVDYDSGLGGMTSIGGIEDGENFVVQENIALNKKNNVVYNNHHFLDHRLNFESDRPPVDLFIASPNFGDKIRKKGISNFDTSELYECLAYISLRLPPHVLISIYDSAITPLQIDSRVTETYDNIPTNDIIIGKMNDLGYDVQNFILDMSTYILPQVKKVMFYYCWKKSESPSPIKLPIDGKLRNKLYVGQFLERCHNKHPLYGKKDWSKKEVCSKIQPGSNALKTKDVSVSKGYLRFKTDMVCPNLGVEFYKVSGSGWCIHPHEDRPLTIQEGAVLSGFHEDYLNGLKVSKREAASMIFRAVPPAIGNKIRKGLLDSIG